MTWKGVHTFEDESPRHIGGTAYDFGIHQVAHAYGKCTDGSDNGHIVQYVHEVQLNLARVQYYCQHKAEGASVRGKSLVSGKVTFAIGKLYANDITRCKYYAVVYGNNDVIFL